MKFQFLFFFSFLISSLAAQVITVKDKITLQPIESASVNGKSTDERGQISIDSVRPKGNNKIYIFSKGAYFSDTFSLAQLKNMNYIVLLTDNVQVIGNVVYSVSKFRMASIEAAQQSAIIERKQMQFMNQPNTADMLQQSGRAFVQKSQMGGGSIVMRGFEANKVLMVVDGVRMNNAIYRGGHLQNVLSIDQNMLDRSELLFGPGSVVYGSDALGGVIHFYTRKPVFSKEKKPYISTSALTRYASASDEKTAHFDFNIGFRNIAFLSSVTYSDFDDLRIGKRSSKGYENWGKRNFYVKRFGDRDSMVKNNDSFRQVPGGYTQTDLMQKILFSRGKGISHLLNIQYSTTSDIPRYDRLTEVSLSGVPLNAEWYYGPQNRKLLSYTLSIDKKTGAFERASIIAAYQDISESRHNRSFNSINKTNRSERVKLASLNADFEKLANSKTSFRYGIEFANNFVTSLASRENINTGIFSPQSTRYPDGGSDMRSAAVYITQTSSLSKKLILSTGLRFTAIHLESRFIDKTFFPFLGDRITQNNQNTSGSAGIVYLPDAGSKIAFSVASGFRAANVDDVAKVFESTGGRIIIPNASVKPEQTLNFDLTLGKTFAKKLNAEMNLYYTHLSNALTFGTSSLNGNDSITFNGVRSAVYTMQNAQQAYVSGIYTGIAYDINKIWNIRAHVNYTYGRILTDSNETPLDHISPVYGMAGLTYKNNKIRLELFSLFNGAKKSVDYNLSGEDNQLYSAEKINGYSPAWFTANIRGTYRISSIIQFQVSLENILNQHYRTFSSGSSAAGRNLVLSLRGNF